MTGPSSVIARPAFTSSSTKAGGRGSRSTPRTASTARRATSRTRPRTSTGSCPKAEEAPITRTCSRPLAPLIAAALLLSAAPVMAAPSSEDALLAYVRARAAETVGADAQAGRGYAAALALSPGNDTVAARALSHAISIGDEALALTAAKALRKQGKLAPDARLLLLGDAVKRKDWKTAAAEVDRIDKDEVFSFMAPTLRAWVALGSGKGDPIALLATGPEQQLAATYAAEHRPLLLIAK